ncbi:MAG: RnfABCDGE type electron transport complex subunit D [Gammaproteobacteria bacterium]|nr:RnfABCDGE type electron transport complex subunit D [Gammaproteobacteria bacterium]MDH5802549.1 RnfABCDGE type electron transport complex subunit D [Gammaproteobacteria bacterium]
MTWLSLPRDPRWYQISVLAALIGYGLIYLQFEIYWITAVLILLAAQISQYACTRIWNLPIFDPRSALISSLSLCLLLRTEDWRLAILAAMLAVVSKFVIHLDRKHVFNPTNFALAACLLLSDSVWVSSGQWGSTPLLAFLMACLGGVVLYRTERSDITFAFLAAYSLLLLLRAWWLGDPWSIPLHYLQNGALLIFAFFMISDPRTIPDSRLGRIGFAIWVAILAVYLQFQLHQPNALIWALVCSSPLVPLIDKISSAHRYHWPIERNVL